MRIKLWWRHTNLWISLDRDESLCRLKTRKREFYDNVLVCYQLEIFFHFRFFLTYKCETLNIRNICPQGATEKQKLKVKNTKNKFLIIFEIFFERKKSRKILTGRKKVRINYWKVWNDSWVTHSSRFFWKFMGRMRAVGLCTFLWICVCLWVENGNGSIKVFTKIYISKTYIHKTYIDRNVHLQKHTFTETYIYWNIHLQKRTFTETYIYKNVHYKNVHRKNVQK